MRLRLLLANTLSLHLRTREDRRYVILMDGILRYAGTFLWYGIGLEMNMLHVCFYRFILVEPTTMVWYQVLATILQDSKKILELLHFIRKIHHLV